MCEKKSHLLKIHCLTGLEVMRARVSHLERGKQRRKAFVQNTLNTFFPVFLGCLLVSRASGRGAPKKPGQLAFQSQLNQRSQSSQE